MQLNWHKCLASTVSLNMHFFKATDKWAHTINLLVIIVIGLIVVLSEPILVKDIPTTFGTLGFFITAYGVIFAIVELLRVQNATTLANLEAKKVFSTLNNLITAREIMDCQHAVRMAIASLDENKPIATVLIVDIIKFYSQVFHAEVILDDSSQRKNRSIIQSYSFNPNINSPNAGTYSTKSALLSIAGELAQLQGASKNLPE
jgi:hypothetical protein